MGNEHRYPLVLYMGVGARDSCFNFLKLIFYSILVACQKWNQAVFKLDTNSTYTYKIIIRGE